jgi:hypothetical protein
MFGIGKKKKEADITVDAALEDEAGADAADVVEQKADEETVGSEGYDREESGPWDISEIYDDDDIKRIDLGALKIPGMDGMELRLQVNKERTAVTSALVTKGNSTLELSAFAAPRSGGLWEDVREEIVESNENAHTAEGTFGDEILLSVSVGKGKAVDSRIVGVDGPRWMLRGIFTGAAAHEGAEQEAFNELFSQIIVERGPEPLAPRDLLPMHPPIDTRAAQQAQAARPAPGVKDISQPDGPLSQDQQTQVQTTLARGPMFSEIR